jgi:carboxylesterase type B
MAQHFSVKQENTYRYLFNHKPSSGIQVLGVYHAAELAFMFHRAMGGLLFPSSFSEEEEEFSRIMINYWANFAKFGNPSPADQNLPTWPKFSKENPATQILALQVETANDYKNEICDFWAGVYPE